MAKRATFGTNFTPRAAINNNAASTTKNIAFGNLSSSEKEELKNKLATAAESTAEETKNVDISSFIPQNYTIKKIDRKQLKPAPDSWNFFTKPSKDKLLLLAESIYINGLLQPIIVRELDENGQYYQILAGHTRNEAYKILYDIFEDPKYLNIESIVFSYQSIDDSKAQDIICDTNFMQRGNLPVKDMAKCIYLKAKKYKETSVYGSGSVADKIAEEYKIKRTSVFMWQRLANLTDELQDYVEAAGISLKNAYKIASLNHEDQHILLTKTKNFISNDALKSVKSGDNLNDMINKIKDSYGSTFKSVRFDVADTELKNIKDVPLLVYADHKQKQEIIEAINKIAGAYVIRS